MPVKNPHHYALVVGINEYPGIGSLTKPTTDAKAFYEWLIDPNLGGLDPDHCEVEFQVHPYLGKTAQQLAQLTAAQKRALAQPKSDDVKGALIKLIGIGSKLYREDSAAWTSSRLYIFFAGHGMANTFRDSDLFLADAGQGFYANRAPCEYILNYLVKVRPAFREVIFFADCCRSLKSGAGSAAFSMEDSQWPQLRVRQASCYATLFNDPSYETTKEDGRGFFSQALMEGLKGAAAPAGQRITTDNLRIYVQNRVNQLTAQLPFGPQNPDLHAPELIELLAQSPGPPPGSGPAPRAVTVKFLKFVGRVQLHGPDDQPVAGVPVFKAKKAGALWSLPALPLAIHHIVVLTGDGGLLARGGYFSWKDIPEDNGPANPLEM